MEYKVTKYTIIENYPSILNTSIPIIDIFIWIGYQLWIFFYFIFEFFTYLFKSPQKGMDYIKKFFKKEENFKGFPKEQDFNLDAKSIEDQLNLNDLLENTEETKVFIYKGKVAKEKLKNIIQKNNLYEKIEYLPTGYFILREEILIGNFI